MYFTFITMLHDGYWLIQYVPSIILLCVMCFIEVLYKAYE